MSPPPAAGSHLLWIVLIAVCIAACWQVAYNIQSLDSWLDEGNYLMKGYWYVTGQTHPYSDADSTSYMPIIFYLLGPVEALFGVGYLPGRVLIALLSLPSVPLAYLVGKRLGQSQAAGVACAILLAAHPIALIYFATATPYGPVDTLSLLMVLTMLAMRQRTLAYGLAGLLLWVLVFIRPNLLAIAMVPMAWALLFEDRRGLARLALAVAVFLAASAASVLLFGPGLIEVLMTVPGIKQIGQFLGWPPAPIAELLPLTTSPMDRAPGVLQIAWQFWLYFARPNIVVILLTLGLAGVRVVRAIRDRSERRIKPIDVLVVYFWVAACLHFFLTLNYCFSCMISYSLYFLPIGVLALAGLFGEFSGLLRHPRASGIAVAITLVISALMWAFPVFSDHLRPASTPMRQIASELVPQLRATITSGERVALFAQSAALPQAVWLAGGVIESRTINLPFSHREPLASLDAEQRHHVETLIWTSDMWSVDTIREAIAHDYGTLIVERREAFTEPLLSTLTDGVPFGDLIAWHYRLEQSFTLYGQTFDLYRRRG